MKRLSIVLALSLPLLGACASSGTSGQQAAGKTVGRVERLAAEIAALGTDLAASGTAIDALEQSFTTKGVFDREKIATGDISATYKQYQKSVSAVRSQFGDVSKATESLKTAMTAWVTAWEQDLAQVQSESLRAASEKRRAGAQERYDAVSAELADLWQRTEVHVKHLEEIGIALGADLTPAGVAAVDDDLEEAKEKGETLQEQLAKASEQLAGFAESVRASAPPPPEA